MKKLIDADKLISTMKEWQSRLGNSLQEEFVEVIITAVIGKIAAQPVAFDMEKVLEQLETLVEKHMKISEEAEELGKDYERHMLVHGAQGVAFEAAIEIVKGGGIERT